MTAVALKGMLARKLRVALTAVAVILGVAMISGTYLLTDTIDASFDDIFTASAQGTDVSIVSRESLEDFEAPPAFSAALLERVRAVDGVADASGAVFDEASIRDKQGERIGTGAPSFVSSVQRDPFEAFDFVQGRAPRTADEAALDKKTAEDKGFRVGDRVTVAGDTDAKQYTVVGLAKFGNVDSLAGAAVAVMTLPEAQRVLDKQGRFDEVEVVAEDGVSATELKTRVRAALPASVEVRTGEEGARSQANDISEGFGFIKTALLAFAGIALFVGAFIIYNTFSITVAQRTRELGLLRTLGATRRQVLSSVVLEALVIGLVASLLGLLGGLLLAPGLQALFKSLGLDLPSTGTVIKSRTVIVALLVGVVTTVVASLAPALRATRVAPIASLRQGVELPPGRWARLRTPLAALLTLAGAVIMGVGLFGGGSGNSVAASMGLGAVLIFLGVALLSPRLVRPLASVIGRPLERIGGVTGRLARENTMRNPGRTAVTAAALMIGLALVTFVTIFAAGIKSSVSDAIDRSFAGDLVLQNDDGFSSFPAAAANAIRELPGVEAVAPIRFTEARVAGLDGNTTVSGVEPAAFPLVYRIDWKDGQDETLRSLGRTDALIESKWGEDNGVEVGDRLQSTTPNGRRVTYTVRGALRDRGGVIGEGVIVSNATLAADFGKDEDQFVFIGLADGAALPAVRDQADALLERRFPVVQTLSQQELKDEQAKQVNQLLYLIYALLSLSVIVSLFGIVNTLVLSISERTRELGMLRAIGTSRRQVRRMVRYESVITALIGAVLGTILGVLFAIAIAQPLKDEGFELSYPLLTLLLLMVLAVLAGVLAAVLPARRASRLNVLEALAYE